MSEDYPGPPPLLRRQKSVLETELEKNAAKADAIILQTAHDEKLNQPDVCYDMELKGCVFVGHTNTDLDSIAAAIGAAHLFGGTAARASDINTETEFALKRWGFENPLPFLEIKDVQSRKVCLVDFNQRSQLCKGLNESQIVGIIDHHALRDGAVATDFPIYIDVRPWGSVSTILAHTYFRNRVKLPKNVAGLFLSAILSDTLNLNSPTATPTDRLMVAALARLAEVDDIDSLALEQFKAKAKVIMQCTNPEILRKDRKKYSIKELSMAFGVCETPETSVLMERREALLQEMRYMKAEEGDTLVYFAIIDITNMRSQLLIVGDAEQEVAERAFDAKMDEKTRIIDLGNRVSRKKTMIPPLDALLKSASFALSPKAQAANKKALSPEARKKAGTLKMVYDKNCNGEIRRVGLKSATGKLMSKISVLRALGAMK